MKRIISSGFVLCQMYYTIFTTASVQGKLGTGRVKVLKKFPIRCQRDREMVQLHLLLGETLNSSMLTSLVIHTA